MPLALRLLDRLAGDVADRADVSDDLPPVVGEGAPQGLPEEGRAVGAPVAHPVGIGAGVRLVRMIRRAPQALVFGALGVEQGGRPLRDRSEIIAEEPGEALVDELDAPARVHQDDGVGHRRQDHLELRQVEDDLVDLGQIGAERFDGQVGHWQYGPARGSERQRERG